MSYLDYYRQNPAWATNQWQSIAPPMPSFQPQPSWGGYDYFKSAIGSMNVDPGLYNYGYGSIANASGAMSMVGTSMIEAKLQHRRAYGGLGDILVMTPQAIGAAAAYEVWRNWRYHNGILAQPLAGDVARQREALIGLAIGESAKLWQYARRLGDAAGQAAAAETAAIAAARIFDQANSALIQTGGAYGSLGSTALSGALSPALSSVGGYGGAATSAYGADSMGASLAAPLTRARSASFGSLPISSYGAPALASGAAYAGSGSGMYGGENGLLGAGSGMGMSLNAYGGGGGGMLSGSRPVSPVYAPADGLLGAGSGMGFNRYGGGGALPGSRPVSPVYPPRPLSAYGGAGSGTSYASGSIADGHIPNAGGGIGRRLMEHAIHKRERLAQRAELSAQRAGYGGGYGGYGGGSGGYGGGQLGGSYGRRAYDDIDGYGYGRRRPYSGYEYGGMSTAGGYY